ncbi:MAG TPA: PilZ domain-containing protein [Pyrinomonadaceae bacterium]|nr:PilZ domain-containing protein [Pyrinomonadaceae bacterium]
MNDEREEKFHDQPERRLHDRSRLIIDVFFNGQDSTGVASTKDISLGGLYMNTRAEVPEGETLMVRIPIGKQEIVCSAEVVYRNPGLGLGIRFLDLSDEARATLEREIWNV